jgi:hypothetical protein
LVQVGIGVVSLGWDVSETVESFELQVIRKTDGLGDMLAVSVIDGLEREIELTGLGESVGYIFRIAAIRDGLVSAWTESDLVTTLAREPEIAPQPVLVAPAAPEVLIDAVDVDTVDLRWVSDELVDTLEIEVSESGQAFEPLDGGIEIAGIESLMQVTGLKEGTSYSFRMRAFRAGLASDWGYSAPVTTAITPPPEAVLTAPEAPVLTAALEEPQTVVLNWSASESVEQFEVQYSEDPAGFFSLALFNGSVFEAAVEALEPERGYVFRIRAIRSGYVSEWRYSSLIEIPAVVQSDPDPISEPDPDSEPETQDEPDEEAVLQPVHFWSFDEFAAGQAVDLGTQPADLMLGEVTHSEGIGGSGSGILFSDNHVGIAIPDSPFLTREIIDEITISLWIRLNPESGNQTSLIYEQGGFWRGLNLIVENGWLQANGWNRPSKESDWSGTTLMGPRLIPGEWHHLVLVLKGTSEVQADAFHLYVNSVLVDSGAGSQLWGQNELNGIGQVQKSSNYRGRQIRSLDPLQAGLDELSIWDVALTMDEVGQLYELIP